MKRFTVLLLVAAAVVAGWFARGLRPLSSAVPSAEGRRILRYQSPMHPWIKSDKPGNCTICGMALTPVYEGEASSADSTNLVTLSPASLSVVSLPTVPAVRQPLRRTLRVAGTLEEDESRHRVLSAYAEGRLDQLFVNFEGAEVTAGQPLALIYSPPLLAAVREFLTLSRNPGAGSPLAAAAAQRLAQYGLSEAQIAGLPATFTETNRHVELLAPISGTVVRKEVSAGQTVAQGQALFELADFSTLWFEFVAYEQDLPWLQPGQEVEVTVPSLPGRIFTNAIAFIQPSLDETTRSTKVRVPLPNPFVGSDADRRRLLQHRLYGSGAVKVAFPDLLTVPRSAVLDPGGRPLVFVERSGRDFQSRAVRLGRWGDTDVEVLEGVEAGEHVVTHGALLLDAQAQLNTIALATPVIAPTNASSAGSLESLTAPQLDGVRTAVNAFVEVGISLAADDLPAFNRAAPGLHSTVAALDEVLRSAPHWQALAPGLTRVSHLDPAPDLAAARRQFHALMQAVVPLAQALQRAGNGFETLKVYRCPMTKRAFAGAPAQGDWLQLTGPLRNPYFGAEMPDCGTEVTP